MTLLIFGISATSLVVALVQLAKSVGFPTRYAPLLSLALGLFAGIIVWLANVHPDLAPLLQTAILGLMAGLAASGAYDTVHETAK